MKNIKQEDLLSIKVIKDERTDLRVPYEQKDLAKSLGAKYDGGKKIWYLPSGLNISPFYHWLDIDDYISVREQAEKDGYEFGNYEPTSNYSSYSDFLSSNVWQRPKLKRSSVSESEETDKDILQPLSNPNDSWHWVLNHETRPTRSYYITGKWMLFGNIDTNYEEIWAYVVKRIREGHWYGEAKCSTLIGGIRESFLSQTKPIAIYMANQSEFSSEIDELATKFGVKAVWKSEADTLAGKYAR